MIASFVGAALALIIGEKVWTCMFITLSREVTEEYYNKYGMIVQDFMEANFG